MRNALLFLFFCFAIQLAGQTLPPIPERVVSIECSNKRTDEVLRDIAVQGKFEFAWDARLFDPAKPVTIHAQNVTVRRAIYLIFGNTITFRVKGNYLVLEAAPAPLTASPQPTKKMEYTLSGYVIDSANYVIAHTSIYDSASLAATLSNQFGYYELQLAAGTEPVRIKVSREKFVDTFIVVVPSSNITMDIVMRKIPPPPAIAPVVIDSVPMPLDTVAVQPKRRIDNIPFLDSLIGFEQIMLSKNLTETLRRNGQASVLPFISTNGPMGGAVSNKFSFNLIGGYTGGTSVFELGTVFNIDRGDVQWVQVAGGVNIVEGNTRGLQLGGGANFGFGKMNGLQLGGGCNFLFDTLTGVQLAGGTNFINGHVNGMQVAGGVNIAGKDLAGVQLAGAANITAGSMNRMQVAGAYNYATRVSGLQLAGALNMCMDTMKGAQVAAMNVAENVHGTQFGIFNYAYSYSKGAPIGLISIVVKGIHELEIASSEKGFVNIALRTGTPGLYNILNYGVDPSEASATQRIWTFGYGLGHRFSIHPKFDVALDVVAHHVNKGTFTQDVSEWGQLSLTAEWRPWRPIAIAAGPVLHYYIANTPEDMLTPFQQMPFYTGRPAAGYRDVAWVGATFSIRFF